MGSNHEKNGGRKSRETLPLSIFGIFLVLKPYSKNTLKKESAKYLPCSVHISHKSYSTCPTYNLKSTGLN